MNTEKTVKELEKEQEAQLEIEQRIKPDESKQKEKKKKKIFRGHKWLFSGVFLSLIAAIVFTCFYGFFERQANANLDNPLESMDNMSYIYRNCYVLYRDLYNRQSLENADYMDLYLKPTEECEVSQDEDFLYKIQKMYENGYEEEDGYVTGWISGNSDFDDSDNSISKGILSVRGMQELYEVSNYLNNYFEDMEANFRLLNSNFDYVIQDTVTGEFVTNMSSPNINIRDQFFYVSFLFDEFGNVSVDGDVLGNDATRVRKYANAVIRDDSLYQLLDENAYYTEYQKYMQLAMPTNCRVTFCISKADWQQMTNDEHSTFYLYDDDEYLISFSQGAAYEFSNCSEVYLLMLLIMVFAAAFLPGVFVGEGWKENKICRPALELLLIVGYLLCVLSGFVVELVGWVKSGNAIDSILAYFTFEIAVFWWVYFVNILVLTVLFFGAWYIGICIRALRALGIKEYIKQRSFFYQIFPYVKQKLLGVYDTVVHFDVTKKANKLILKIVIVNAVILFVIGSLWVGGFTIAIIYSVILYCILRKYISDLQKKYSILLKATNEIAEGNLNVTIDEDLGVFEPFKPQIIRIQDGFKRAVEEEVKSQRMKTELITNVSHDLKTPLTAIITYINLLQEEDITEEQRKEYLNTLERKSLRLKVLIEDLFEVSKATSQNISLNIMDIDIINLVKQVQIEMSDKLTSANLDVRIQLPEEKYILPLDSQKTYRIFENLFGNIAKYAMPGTRVYVNANILRDGQNGDTGIEITLKNITAAELHVTPEELTERFVRGDSSRNTEGSGLGLAIAKSFTELQGGKFNIQLDGDLFKVTVSWKKPQ